MIDDPLRDPHLPVLIVTGSSLDGAALVLDTQGYEKVMGSGNDCHLRVEGGNVEFHHARVLWDERGVVLSDEGSSTGTYVNGERIGADHPLEDGDRICLGPPGSRNSVKLLVRVPAAIADAQTVGFAAPALSTLVPPVPALTIPEPDEPILLDPPEQAPPAADEVFFADESPPTPRPEPPRAPPAPPDPSPAPRAAVATPLPSIAVAAPAPVPVVPPPAMAAPPRPRPDYAPELPSIAADRASGEPVVFGDTEGRTPEVRLKRLTRKRAAPARAPSGPPPKALVFGGAAVLVLALVAGAAWVLRGRSGGPVSPGGGGGTVEGPAAGLHVTALDPEVALPGNTVVVLGSNLSASDLTVTVAGVAATIEEKAGGRVRIRVPKLPVVVEGHSVPVVVSSGGTSTRPLDLYLGRLPLVAEVAPRTGVPGDRVVVKGRGFDDTPGGNLVSFGEEPALVLTATSSELAVVVPAPRSALNRVDAPVIVKRGASSSGDTMIFNITRPAAGMYQLKFFGAAVEGDAAGEHAFVATEAGPLLLLTGRGASGSVGERATAVAAALNALVGQDPRFEVRGFAVGVAGRNDPIVTVTPVDANGYTKPLDPAMSGTFSGLPAVAGYWAALLQDAFVLFAKGERPSRVVELSPRGKVLMDLFSEAERRVGRGTGVPTNLVSPPTWSVAKAFREMALVLPTRGGAVAAAAVAGRWQGTMEEAGSPARPLSLELRLEGSGLVGTSTTNVGGIAMNSPLRDLTYANGILSFTLAGGQAPRRVQGKVNGAQLEGTIQADAGAPAGRVSLRYLE